MNGVDPRLDRLEAAIGQNINRALWECGMLAQRESVKNAPRSPKATEVRASRKAACASKGKKPTKNQKAAWASRRNPRSTTRPKPGGLERSIKMQVQQKQNWGDSAACIYVGSDAEAAKYAVTIHDEKGKTWRNRGIGTIAKGARADDKFIERAITDNEKTFHQKLTNALGKAIEQYVKL